MYGEMDPLSGEWTTGVFAAMWAKFNNRANAYNTWIIADGPVDAIWIEDLNTVLDDNKILTLANGDRMPMTPNVKMMFEVETLVNASPATVSRAGIIYVSDTDLDWSPTVEGWVRKQPLSQQALLRSLFTKYMGSSSPTDPGHCIDWLNRNVSQVMQVSRVGVTTGLSDLFRGLTEGKGAIDISVDSDSRIEKIFIYCMFWSVGGLLEADGRVKFDEYIRNIDKSVATMMPKKCQPGETIYMSTLCRTTQEIGRCGNHLCGTIPLAKKSLISAISWSQRWTQRGRVTTASTSTSRRRRYAWWVGRERQRHQPRSCSSAPSTPQRCL
jgi:dynein heavy chain